MVWLSNTSRLDLAFFFPDLWVGEKGTFNVCFSIETKKKKKEREQTILIFFNYLFFHSYWIVDSFLLEDCKDKYLESMDMPGTHDNAIIYGIINSPLV